MLSRWKSTLAIAALGFGLILAGPASGVDEGLQVQMLKNVFNQPPSEWPGILRENSGLIDQTFFERVDARIRWSAENNQVDDALRFAMVGDFACDAVNRQGGYRLGLVVAFQKSGNDDMARSLIDNIMLTHPNSAEARYLRAAYRRADLDFAGAVEDYENLFNRGFHKDDCAYYLGTIYLALDKQSQAEKWFDQGLAVNAQHPGCLTEKEKLKQVARPGGGGFEEIPVWGTNPVAVDPAKHADYFRKAEDLMRKGKLALAEQEYKNACAADRSQAPYWIYLGALEYRLGKLDMATQVLRRGVSLNPKSVEGWRFLGCSFERLFDTLQTNDNLEAARASYKKALELVPGDPVSSMGLERLASKKPKPKTPAPSEN